MTEIETRLKQFCEYAELFKGYQPTTIKRYRNVIGFYRRWASIFTLSDVTSESVRALFVHGRTEREWSANTYINYHKTLTVFFRWCRSEGFMEYDPLEGIEIPNLPKRLPKRLSRNDTFKLLEVVQNYPYPHRFLGFRNHAIFQTFVFAGLRKSELLNLRLIDVDVDNCTIFVRQGKGAKDRIIPISFSLADTLRDYLSVRRRLNKSCTEFFVSLNRNCGFTDSGLKRLVAKIKAASGIDFHIHMLRHTFATLMLEGGCDIYSLSQMMGHSDIKTTTIYLSASAEHLRAQIGKHPLGQSNSPRMCSALVKPRPGA